MVSWVLPRVSAARVVAAIAAATVLSVSGLSAQLAPPGGSETVTLSIVGTTDLHGYLAPRDGRGGLAWFGGYVAALRAAREADGGGVVLVDAGDTWLGGIESNLSEGAVVVDAYNALGYHAQALGNHDLEFGPVDDWASPATVVADRQSALKARARQARFPFLAANLIDGATGEAVAWPNVVPSRLVTVAGVRVGLIGVMTADALSMTLAANVGGLRVAPLAPVVTREARALWADGASVVVVVAHAGGSCGDSGRPADVSSCDEAAEIFDLARRLPPGLVDVIAAGHTHDMVAHEVGGIAIVQAYSWGRAFSRVDLTVDRAGGGVRGRRVFAPHDVCVAVLPTGSCAGAAATAARPPQYEGRVVRPSGPVNAAMAPALAAVGRLRATPLDVTLDQPIGRGPGDAESPLGNLFADALAAAVPGADGALSYGAGPGGLRADLAAGPLTLGAFYDLFPFDNRLVTLTMRGADLRALVRDHLQRPRWRARALGVSGLRIAIGCRGGRDEVEVRRASGRPVGDEERLTLVLTDFLAARARTLEMVGVAAVSTSAEVQVRDAALAWVRRHRALLSAAFAVPGAPRWQRTDASVAGCQTPGPHAR